MLQDTPEELGNNEVLHILSLYIQSEALERKIKSGIADNFFLVHNQGLMTSKNLTSVHVILPSGRHFCNVKPTQTFLKSISMRPAGFCGAAYNRHTVLPVSMLHLTNT